MMKRVLIFHPTIAPYRIDFFNDLYKAFDTQICLYYKNLKDQKFQYDSISEKFQFQPDYFEKSIRILGREIPVGFVKRIRKFQPEIVIVNEYAESYWMAFFYRVFSGKKYKILSICDDSADIVLHEGGLHAKARELALQHIDGVILCNNAAAELYKKKYPKVPTVVMPIIQKEEHFFANQEAIKARALEIAKQEKLFGKRVFLYVGRISPEKNPLYLVKSFIKQYAQHPENVLYVIGNHIPEQQAYNDEIDKYIVEQDAASYVRKIGRREGDELKAWFYAGQVVVVPSVREPFCAVTNEALLCGNYVMLTSIAGSTGLIDEGNGEVLDVTQDCIDFAKMNERVPELTETYIESKKNKMNCAYKECVNSLISWIEMIR